MVFRLGLNKCFKLRVYSLQTELPITNKEKKMKKAIITLCAMIICGILLIYFGNQFPYVPFSTTCMHNQLLSGGAMIILLSPVFAYMVYTCEEIGK